MAKRNDRGAKELELPFHKLIACLLIHFKMLIFFLYTITSKKKAYTLSKYS